jgi:HSP20 family protein
MRRKGGEKQRRWRIMARELTPWRPMRELTTLRDEMDRLWDRMFRGWPTTEFPRTEWIPTFDVSETKDSVVVKAEVPGMDPKDIDISLADGILTLKGEKKQEREEKEENYYLTESSYGSFSRSIRLPHEVQGDKVKANCKNGILKITMPKSEEAKKKEIKVKVE